MKLNFTKEYWMSDTFKKLILKDTTEVPEYNHTPNTFVLEKDSYDSEILPKVKTFTREQVLYLLKTMTKDEESPFLLDGHANIFYVNIEDRTVVVGARLHGGKWYFACYELDEDSYWAGGDLVLDSAMVDTKALSPDPLTLETLDTSLEDAISQVKSAGYKVYKVETITKEIEV